jgi:hypothetical protein
MSLAIKIGTGSNIYTNVLEAFQNRGTQKLSIVGTGSEIKAAMADGSLTTAKSGIGSIKATSDIHLLADDVTTYKDVILKLGSRSVVTTDDNTEIKQNFQALDAVYNKMKSLVSSNSPVTVTADDLSKSVNLSGLQSLVGRGNFNVSITGASASLGTENFTKNLDALLRNASKIGTITFVTAGAKATLNGSQLGILGAKLADGTGILKDTADNLLASAAKANYAAVADKVDTINVTKASLIQVSHLNSAVGNSIYADGKMGDIVISDSLAKLTASAGANITAAVGYANAWNSGAGTVSKIIIEGNGSLVTKTDLDTIKSLALDQTPAAINVAYSGKALDVQKNLGALVENISGATAANRLDQIIVTDGNIASKKQFGVTYSQWSTLNSRFTAGQAISTNTNYSFMVSGVATNASGTGDAATMQSNAKVSSFTVKDVPAGLTTTHLTTLLGNSKLKNATIISGMATDDVTSLRTALSAVSSNVDRAKLKFIS